MKLVIQRVKKAQVIRVDDREVVGKIGLGLFVLVGFKKGDSEESVRFLAQKLVKLRIMSDKNDKMNLSVSDVGGEMLIVSQFTLYADTDSGNRPSFINAEHPDRAKELYNLLIDTLIASGIKVETGSFGDYMEIEAVLDGPVTIIYD